MSSPVNRTLLILLLCDAYLFGVCVGSTYLGTVTVLLVMSADEGWETRAPGVPKMGRGCPVSVWENSDCVDTT